jgi:ketosteroid isomerase-like protein
VLVALLAPAIAASRTVAQAPTSNTDSAAVAAVVERFHEALGEADSATALSLLHPDVVILESGELEMLADYRAHHLPADIEFSRAIPGERSPVRVAMRGDAAWVTSTSRTKGTFRGRAIDSAGAELMVLTREADGWRIQAIHWSSHAQRRRGG